MGKRTVLFIQLPRLDHDVAGARENVPLAAAYLAYAIERSPEGRFWRCQTLPSELSEAGDARLLREILRHAPDVVAATLYLWNVERTLDLLARLRAQRPALRVVVGGPEVARDHPFLFYSRVPDAVVEGEGEAVLPDVLRALRKGGRTNHANVAWRGSRGYRWGRSRPAPCDLASVLPPPGHRLLKPDANGIACLETSRGCPLRCSYCRYGHRRQRVSFIESSDVLGRVRTLVRRGAREIRFVDPTFNSNPAFRGILAGLAQVNPGGRLRFFAELRAETLTREEVRLLARAGFREIEVGVQTRNPETLRRIHRPARLDALDRAISWLTGVGIEVTVDLMFGLPGQDRREIASMLRWAGQLRGPRVQCLQTLLLPGTDLRASRARWGMVSYPRPPYEVHATSTLTLKDMRKADLRAQEILQVEPDVPTTRFVGRRLPDLFGERILTEVPSASVPPVHGECDRRAMVFVGRDLFACRAQIVCRLNEALTEEPHILWQFVLAPEQEEPLDLLDLLIAELKERPSLVPDRFIQLHSPGRLVSRRIFVHLRNGRRYDRTWQAEAEELLRRHFF